MIKYLNCIGRMLIKGIQDISDNDKPYVSNMFSVLFILYRDSKYSHRWHCLLYHILLKLTKFLHKTDNSNHRVVQPKKYHLI